MARSKTTQDLWAELRGLLKLAGQVTRRAAAVRRPSRSTRGTAALRRAVAKGDLARVRAAIPDETAGNEAQNIVVYAYACFLETESAGLSILFDRFSPRERRRIAAALATIDATVTHRDLRRLELAFAQRMLRERSRVKTAEWLGSRPLTQRLDRQSGRHAAEIEKKLVRYCREHVEELAAAPRGARR